MDQENDVWLTREQVAERLQLPPATLREWAARRPGKEIRGPQFARIGRYVRYRLSDVIAWERERLAAACSPTSMRPGPKVKA